MLKVNWLFGMLTQFIASPYAPHILRGSLQACAYYVAQLVF